MTIKIQKIHECRQCGDLLPLKCLKCLAHPDRKPRIVELYGLPPILETGPCGCVRIACEREGCARSVWRRVYQVAKHPSRFCGDSCARIFQAARRNTQQEVTCANPGCERGADGTRKRFKVKVCRLRGGRQVCCCPACMYAYRIVKTARRDALEGVKLPPPESRVVTVADLEKRPLEVRAPKPIAGHSMAEIRRLVLSSSSSKK